MEMIQGLHTSTSFLSQRVSAFVFLVLLVAPLLSAGWASLAYLGVAVYCVLTIPKGISKTALGVRQIWPFLAILLIGLLQAYLHSPQNVIKDCWYFQLPILTFITGWLFAPSVKEMVRSRVLVIASLASAIWFLFHLMTVFSKVSINDQYAYRQEVGGANFIVVWGILVCLDRALHWQELNASWRKLVVTSLIVNPIAVALSFSRTEYGALALALFLVWLPAMIKKRRLYNIGIAGIIVVGLFGLVSLKIASRDDGGFIGRMAGSFREVDSSNFDNMSDVNTRWRAYEALMGLKTYLQGNPIQFIVGQGLGTQVDLGMVMPLGDADMQYIPILHNGYVYLLVKTGVLGLLLFLWQIRLLWRGLRTREQTTRVTGDIRLGKAILLATLLAMLVITGPYNKGGWFLAMLLLGMVLRNVRGSKVKLDQRTPTLIESKL